jgi:hypothetical protein
MWLLYQGLKSKKEKSDVRDSICLTLKIHRKAATRLMRKKQIPQLRRRSGCRLERYSKDTRRWFIHLWLKMGRICARRMKAALPEWLPMYFEADISKSVKNELYAMGTSTMDRILKPIRAQLKRQRNSGTRLSPHISIIPLRPSRAWKSSQGCCGCDKRNGKRFPFSHQVHSLRLRNRVHQRNHDRQVQKSLGRIDRFFSQQAIQKERQCSRRTEKQRLRA